MTRANADPSITVVVPCFNAGQFLRATLTSVTAQTRVDWECVIVDDGSTDDSLLIAKAAAADDARISVVGQPNRGVHVARQLGAERAHSNSRYLVFLDADDLIEPTFLAELSTHLENHPHVGMVYGACVQIDRDGHQISGTDQIPARFVPQGWRVRELPVNELDTPLDAIVSRYEAIPSTAMLRRSVFERTWGWRPGAGVEDKDMAIQMALQAPVHFLPTHLTRYRRHESNRSLDNFWKHMDDLHTEWWNDDSLDPASRLLVRRSLVFDRRIAARTALGAASTELTAHRWRAAATSVARATKRLLEWALMDIRARSSLTSHEATHSATPATHRILALHLTKPSTSEAKVLATLLRHIDPEIGVDLVVNRAGLGDDASHFRSLEQRPNIRIRSVRVGLPIDPATPDSALLRWLARSLHPLHRERLVWTMRRSGSEAIYTSQQRFDCRLGEILATRWRIPQVVHLHYTIGPWLRRPTLDRLTTCDRLIAISDFIGRQALAAGVAPDRLTVIPNTIEVSAQISSQVSERSGDRVVVGQTGRIAPGKGFTETVAMFADIHQRHPNTELLLVGDGPERDLVEDTISRLGLSESVRSVGWQADITEWLPQIDIFVHPSKAEPFGLAVLEAMAWGIPVVAYGDAGVGEIIVDGDSGFLHEPDDLQAMTASIECLVTDRALRSRIGSAARERAIAAFHPAPAGRSLSNLLVDLVEHRRTDEP